MEMSSAAKLREKTKKKNKESTKEAWRKNKETMLQEEK